MESISLNKFRAVLQKAVEINASDIHISGSIPVYFRRKNKLMQDADFIFSETQINQIVNDILSDLQQKILQNSRSLDCAYMYEKRRFRLNIFPAMRKFNIAARLISQNILDIDTFVQRDVLKKQIHKNHGLILICGATGTGKSTTLASMLDYINRFFTKHIITLEDPVEYVFAPGKSLIQQREFNEDFHNFSQAVKMALRQDPDIIMIGEIRDTETMKAALEGAETGHLVLGTLHAASAVEAVMRMESFFPQEKMNSICTQIAHSLNSIIVQRLLPAVDGDLVCCMEILLAVPAVKNIIRQGQNQQLMSQMQLNKQKGMQTMQDSINYFIGQNIIAKSAAGE